MTARARVRAIHVGNLVDVEFLPPARCRGCAGSCTWFRAPDAGELRLRAAVPVTVGQTVQVSLPGRYVLLGAVLLHGLPWGMLLLGQLIAEVTPGPAVEIQDLHAIGTTRSSPEVLVSS